MIVVPLQQDNGAKPLKKMQYFEYLAVPSGTVSSYTGACVIDALTIEVQPSANGSMRLDLVIDDKVTSLAMTWVNSLTYSKNIVIPFRSFSEIYNSSAKITYLRGRNGAGTNGLLLKDFIYDAVGMAPIFLNEGETYTVTNTTIDVAILNQFIAKKSIQIRVFGSNMYKCNVTGIIGVI